MKKIVVLALFFSCVFAFPQEEELPQIVEAALKNKYPDSELDSWWIDNNLYYLDFYLEANSYTSVFNKKGAWIETSEIISEFDIPEQLQDYISDNFLKGKISYCEKVEAPDSPYFIRVSLSDGGKIVIIQSDNSGDNIKIIKEENE